MDMEKGALTITEMRIYMLEKVLKVDWKTRQWILATLILAISAVIYTRPYCFEDIMPGIKDAPVIKCEATYYTQETGENGKEQYRTIYKEFDVSSGDYILLMKMLESVTYRKPLSVAFSGGKRSIGYSVYYPYSMITFYQDSNIYLYCLYNQDLPAGLLGDQQTYTPQGGGTFQSEVSEFIHTHGKTINEEIEQY